MKKHLATLTGVVGLLSVASIVSAADALKLPFFQKFDKPLDAVWKADVSKDNKIELADGALRISAAANTYAHIERPLGADLVRAECVLKPGGGVSWISSLFLYWNPRNWCQVSVLETEASYYVVRLVDGKLMEQRFSFAGAANWYRVAIELAGDCLRFQACKDGESWEDLTTAPRPGSWMGKPPELLAIGKGFSREEGGQNLAAANLNNDFPERGATGVSLVREVSVVRLPAERAHTTAAEMKRLADEGGDSLGEKELTGPNDPSFASVSRYFPPMKAPKESLGVKDGPQEFVVMPDGSLNFAGVNAWFAVGSPPTRLATAGCERLLLEGYLPIVLIEWDRDGLKYQQTAVAWSPEMSPDTLLAALVHLKVSNPGAQNRKVDVQFVVKEPMATWSLDVPSQGEQSVYLKIPFDKPATAAKTGAAEFDKRQGDAAAFWKALLSKGMKIAVPEQRVNDAWRAWLAYNFINVDKRGKVYEPCDGGGGFYEEVYGYSAARYCYALDLWGYHAEARQYLDSALSFVTPEGLLVLNYGLPDTGAQLWAMGQHYRMTGDAEWLRKVAPTMIRMCNWIIAARRSSMAQVQKDAPWHGLIKYRPYCDEPNPAYSYHTDTYLLLGLQETAAALHGLGMTDEAALIASEAKVYGRDILDSMDKAVIERFGMKMLPMFPETHALLERVDYTGADYYSLVSSIVLETDVLPPDDRRARLITDLLQRRKGLCLGTCAFQGGIDHAYSYGYWMNCLQRDDVKRAILGLYTSMAYGMSRDTYAGAEVTKLRTGENYATLPHLYSGTQQLLLLRNMLLREYGDTLMLGQAVPRPWLEDGKEVRVEDAPTLFGDVGYSIKCHDGARKMTVRIEPPTKRLPRAISVRLRHPASKAIEGVTINGVESKSFTADTVTLTRMDKSTTVEVRYEP